MKTTKVKFLILLGFLLIAVQSIASGPSQVPLATNSPYKGGVTTRCGGPCADGERCRAATCEPAPVSGG